jgi:benzodiazapine receptor
MVDVTRIELFVWFLQLVLLAWLGGNALLLAAARAGGGGAASDVIRSDYGLRPSWAPPPWLFGVVWPVLYVLLAVAGYRVRLHASWHDDAAPLVLYVLLLAALAAWPAIYSGLKRRRAGMAVHAAAFALAVAFCIVAWRRSPLAGALTLPLCAWLAFAFVLAAAIERMRACAPECEVAAPPAPCTPAPTPCAPAPAPARAQTLVSAPAPRRNNVNYASVKLEV